ncbi:cytochrome c oxidase assembly protein [Salipaludibacillus aurantiacus]|uniref:Putative membrane protein n=1 Tax=Salipaludibacillus aurantiacus TaxID=1601833 RepID=A0A1H9QAC5_9BACI|nr:cytochrome c oxidase assembly protein [Salipaludibacillus aurantiacus]SER57404.1 putative membrane protein [Salipaludibacillus aurantiacus]
MIVLNHSQPHGHSHSTAFFDVAGLGPQLILAFPFAVALVIYLFAAATVKKKGKSWQGYRVVLFTIGAGCALAAVIGPLAEWAHANFTVHMLGHLLLGMLAPLLMVLAAPVTLLLRAMPVKWGRRLTKVLKSLPARIVTDPAVASLLNIGGLWILYTTELYAAMHDDVLLHLFIHMHVFLAGYVFTASMISIDPMPHRTAYLYRAIVLVLALAGHQILSKFIYANPPAGVPRAEAEAGGQLMFYGGDAVDVFIIFMLCLQWYRAARPRGKMSQKTSAGQFTPAAD